MKAEMLGFLTVRVNKSESHQLISVLSVLVKTDTLHLTILRQILIQRKRILIPATLLKIHPDFILYVDEDSAAGIVNF